MAKFLPQLLEIVVVFRDDVLGDGFVAAVGFIKEHALLKEPAEERAQQLGLLDAGAQLAHEFTAHITITLLLALTHTRTASHINRIFKITIRKMRSLLLFSSQVSANAHSHIAQ